MNTDLKFDFTIDKENRTVNVKREFAATSDLVWEAYTNPEILDQWWAPKPWLAKTKSMDFRVGGKRIYAMVGPEGEEHWAMADFTSITPKLNFKYLDAFCDNEGTISDEMPRSSWNLNFIAQDDITLVEISIGHGKLEDLEMIIEMGFKEGFSAALNGLDKVLLTLKLK